MFSQNIYIYSACLIVGYSLASIKKSFENNVIDA